MLYFKNVYDWNISKVNTLNIWSIFTVYSIRNTLIYYIQYCVDVYFIILIFLDYLNFILNTRINKKYRFTVYLNQMYLPMFSFILYA